MKKSLVGFSLIEVLVFTTVLGLFFVAAMTVTTFNLKNMKIQEYKILATRYAEEGVEWLKQEKEDDWQIFIAHSAGNYCLNSLGWNSACAPPNDYILNAFFKRELKIIKPPTVDQVEGTVTVYWKEGIDDYNVTIKTVFRILE